MFSLYLNLYLKIIHCSWSYANCCNNNKYAKENNNKEKKHTYTNTGFHFFWWACHALNTNQQLILKQYKPGKKIKCWITANTAPVMAWVTEEIQFDLHTRNSARRQPRLLGIKRRSSPITHSEEEEETTLVSFSYRRTYTYLQRNYRI